MENRIMGAALTVQRSSQTLEGLLQKMLGQDAIHNAGKEPVPLSGWAAKVKSAFGNSTKVAEVKKPFLFKKGKYDPMEIVALIKLCEQEYGKYAPSQCRKGTDQEWKIVQGFEEGSFLAKQLPQFIWKIMTQEDEVRLVQTIRAHVEGCLTLDLKGESPIKEAFLRTRSIQESIATAATTRSTGIKELWALIAQVQTISYNQAITLFFNQRKRRKICRGHGAILSS